MSVTENADAGTSADVQAGVKPSDFKPGSDSTPKKSRAVVQKICKLWHKVWKPLLLLTGALVAVIVLTVLSGVVEQIWDAYVTQQTEKRVQDYLGKFFISPGAGGIAAVLAALVGASALFIQLRHTKKKDREENWWERFEWITERSFPSKVADSDRRFPRGLALPILRALENEAKNQLQRASIGSFLDQIYDRPAPDLWTSGNPETGESVPPAAGAGESVPPAAGAGESVPPAAGAGESGPKPNFESERVVIPSWRGASLQSDPSLFWKLAGTDVRDVSEEEVRSLGEYVAAAENSPGVSRVAARIAFRASILQQLIRQCDDVVAFGFNVFQVSMDNHGFQVVLLPDAGGATDKRQLRQELERLNEMPTLVIYQGSWIPGEAPDWATYAKWRPDIDVIAVMRKMVKNQPKLWRH